MPLWTPITFCADLRLRWSFKKSYNPCQELSNNMWHAPYTHVIQGDSWLLRVGNQIDTLTPCLSFDHNLCCKYSIGSCKNILDIYISKNFQWYNDVLNPMNLDLSNFSLKIWGSLGTPIPKMGAHLGVCGLIPSHFLELPKVWMWFPGYIFGHQLSMPLATLVARLRLGLWQ